MLISTNPATGEEIARHAEMDDPAIEAAVDRADATFRIWSRTPIAQRLGLLTRIAEGIERDREALAEMATREMGKTLASSLAEVDKCASAFRFYAEQGEAMLASTAIPLAGGGTGEARWMPLGPVLAVMPWNFPYWQVVRFLAPTILAGNVGLLKHASIVQGCAGLLVDAVVKAGAPDGLFQENLAITSAKVGALLADPRIVAATVTGSEGAGAAVAEACGKALKPVVLELGGSDPFVVMPSADLDKAVAAAVKARVQNTGQSCICAKRMIVHRDLYPAFAERFTAAMRAVAAGDPMDEASDMGPLSSLAQRETVLEQLARATAAGATLAGGEAVEGPGAYIQAGVLTGLDPTSDIAAEEIFGPVAMLFEAKDAEDAIRIANAVPFGLGGSIWTNDAAERERLLEGIETGMIAVNQMLASTPEAPFGGVKRSGHGRELGRWGLHAFLNLKTILPAA